MVVNKMVMIVMMVVVKVVMKVVMMEIIMVISSHSRDIVWSSLLYTQTIPYLGNKVANVLLLLSPLLMTYR